MSRLTEQLRAGAIVGIAGMAVLAAHIAGGVGLMHAARSADIRGMPEVFYVDMAPELSGGPQQTDYDSTEEAAPEPEEEPEPEVEPEPEPEPQPEPEPEPETELAPDFIPPELAQLEPLEDFSSLVEQPAVVLSQSQRPKPRPKREVTRQEEPKAKRTEKPRAQPAARAPGSQIDAPRSERATAPKSDQGSKVSKAATQSWQTKISAQVARHMKRARLPGQRSRVEVKLLLSVDGGGRVTLASLQSSTGNANLDSSLNRQSQRIPRLLAPPDGVGKKLVVRIIVE